MTRTYNRRWGALSLVAAALATATLQVITAGNAAATAPGLHRTASPLVGTNTVTPKTATATCGAGEQVIGGGAFVNDFGAAKVMLTALQPIHGGLLDRYVAIAEAPPGFAGVWNLTAYALCARGLSPYKIVSETTEPASKAFQATAAVCDPGTLAIGSGARVFNGAGQVGLQLNRTSGPRDISRATAREDASYSGMWTLTSYAICAPGLGLTSEGTVSTAASVLFKCPSGFVHSVGGGGSLTDVSGLVYLQVVFPSGDRDSIQVSMTGPAGGGGMAVQAICG